MLTHNIYFNIHVVVIIVVESKEQVNLVWSVTFGHTYTLRFLDTEMAYVRKAHNRKATKTHIKNKNNNNNDNKSGRKTYIIKC